MSCVNIVFKYNALLTTLRDLLSKTTGKANGTIAKRELRTLPTDLIYRCQEKAWFDQPVMMEWVEKVLGPYVANVPHGIVPILFLDNFSVHKTGAVVEAIQALGVEVEFIPPGCTGMVQQVDVGFNKSLKSKFRDQYREWMLDQDPSQSIPCPSRALVAEWLIAAQRLMTPALIRNAWKKTGFSWFLNQEKD